jgi:hypothetical protein
MTRFKSPVEDDLEALRDEFIAHSAAQSITSEVRKTNENNSISVSQLYAYANGDIPYPDEKIENTLKKAPGLRTAYRRILAGFSNYTFQRAIAASEGELPSRKTVGAEINFSNSSAHKDRVYIIINLTPDAELTPSTLIVFDTDDRSIRIDLPRSQDGIIQLSVSRTSDIITALKNPDTSILLT